MRYNKDHHIVTEDFDMFDGQDKEKGALEKLSGTMEKFLLRNGADEVIYTERETAERFAMRFGSAGINDYFKLSEEYAKKNKE